MKLSTLIIKGLKKGYKARRQHSFGGFTPCYYVYSPKCGCLVGVGMLASNKEKALEVVKEKCSPYRFFPGVPGKVINEVDRRFESGETSTSILLDLKARGL